MTALFLLDTSALLALRDDEPGAARVAELLQNSVGVGSPRCFACFMTRMELLYRVWKDEGEQAGRLADEQLLALPMGWVDATDGLLQQAAAIKARHALSVADAWIAAAALQKGAVLVHKDPEFRALQAVSQEWLG